MSESRGSGQEQGAVVAQVKWKNCDPPNFSIVLYSKPLECGWQGLKHVDAGLQNLGNTCFINAAVQVLFHTPPFLHWLEGDKEHRNLCKETSCVTCALASLWLEMTYFKDCTSPLVFLSKLQEICPHMKIGRQEDCHEFFVALLDKLDREFVDRFEGIVVDYCSKFTSAVGRMFAGWEKSDVKCPGCGKVSLTFLPFQQLTVSCDAGTVQEGINEYFCREDVNYKCETCGAQGMTEKNTNVHIYPTILVVQLRRFNNNHVKIKTPINIDFKVSLTHRSNEYQLAGAVLHLGETSNSGHYISVVRCPEGNFCILDDLETKPYASTSVKDVAMMKKNSYLLVYERTSIMTNNILRQEAKPLKVGMTSILSRNVTATDTKEKSPSTPKKNIEGKAGIKTPLSTPIADKISKVTAVSVTPKTNAWKVQPQPPQSKVSTPQKDVKVTPIKISMTVRQGPKESASQSSHEYELIPTTSSPPFKRIASRNRLSLVKNKVTPIKVMKKPRAEPKVTSSQSSHDYEIMRETHGASEPEGRDPNIVPGPRLTPIKIRKSKKAIKNKSSEEATSVYEVVSPTKSTDANVTANDVLVVDSNENPQNTSDAIAGIILQGDVPGSMLQCTEIGENTVSELRRWLHCRGINQVGKKEDLIAKVRACKEMGMSHILDVGIDGGKWYEEKKMRLQGKIRNKVSKEPNTGWGNFPSVNIPDLFNYGHIFHFFVESDVAQNCREATDDLSTSSDEDDPDSTEHMCTTELCSGCMAEEAFSPNELSDVQHHKIFRRGMQFLKSQFVRKIVDTKKGGEYFLQAQVRASMKKSFYLVNVTISDKSGHIMYGACECKQSARGRCSHVSAVLLHVWTHIKLNGYGGILVPDGDGCDNCFFLFYLFACQDTCASL